jgi:uncharacterized membrane protein YbaN (DUF454 family)
MSGIVTELGIVGLMISSLITLLFYTIVSFNKREDKRTESFQETIFQIHTMHKDERAEWKHDATIRQEQTNDALKELSCAIQDLVKTHDISIKV